MVQVGVIFTHLQYETTSPHISFSPKLYPLEPCFHFCFYKSTSLFILIIYFHLLHHYNMYYTMQLLLFHYPLKTTWFFEKLHFTNKIYKYHALVNIIDHYETINLFMFLKNRTNTLFSCLKLSLSSKTKSCHLLLIIIITYEYILHNPIL